MNPSVPITALQPELAQNLIVTTYKDQYSQLLEYSAEIQRTNPGSTIKIDLEPAGEGSLPSSPVFRRIYCCFAAMKLGFAEGCRPFLGLNGIVLKGPYRGRLLAAVATNANNGIYPFAWAVVEAENIKCWEWFLECLGEDLGLSRTSNFCFMSHRQKALIFAITKVFPMAEHRYCLKHISDTMKVHHKDLDYKNLLWRAARATNVPNFYKAMDDLGYLDRAAYDYLAAIPPRHWSKSHFSTFSTSDLLDNNLCETFKSSIVEARDKPIITCLEVIRDYVMKHIALVEKKIEKSHSILCPNIQERFDETKEKASKLRCTRKGVSKYKVWDLFGEHCVVDLVSRTCSCRKWDVRGIPCKHVVRAIWENAKNGGDGLPENWVDECYKLSTWKKIYAHKINPITQGGGLVAGMQAKRGRNQAAAQDGGTQEEIIPSRPGPSLQNDCLIGQEVRISRCVDGIPIVSRANNNGWIHDIGGGRFSDIPMGGGAPK